MNEENILYLLSYCVCISWVFKKVVNNYKNKVIHKSLPSNSECIIALTIIQKYDKYYQCGLCTQVYLKDILDEWFKIKSNQNLICPHCKTLPIDIQCVYINY